MPDTRSFNLLTLKRSAWCCFAAMAVLLVLAAIYYRERMVFTDAAVIAFRRINLHDLESSQRRYGAYITEWVPLAFPYLHIPIKVIELAYSLSFNAFYLAVMYFLTFRWKKYVLAILMSSYYLLFCSAAYYWTNNEIHQAVAYLFLCLGWSSHLREKGSPRALQLFVFTLTAALALFTHPICIVTTVFVWVFLLLDGRSLPYTRRELFVHSGILLAIIIIKFSLSSNQDYDSWRMAGILKFKRSDIGTLWHGPVAKLVLKQCLINYWWGSLLFAVGLLAMLQQKRYLGFAWALASFIGFFALLCISFPHGNFPYAIEAESQTFGVMAMAPFAYYGLPRMSVKTGTALIAIVMLTRLGYVLHSAGMFTRRLAYIEHMLTRMREKGLNKVIIKARDGVPEGELFLDWGLATESTILSALQGEYPQRTVCSLWPDQGARIPKVNNEMVWNFDNRPTAVLNKNYFSIDTTHPYVQMTYEEVVK